LREVVRGEGVSRTIRRESEGCPAAAWVLANTSLTGLSLPREMKEIVLVWHDEHRKGRANLAERVDRLEWHLGISRG